MTAQPVLESPSGWPVTVMLEFALLHTPTIDAPALGRAPPAPLQRTALRPEGTEGKAIV